MPMQGRILRANDPDYDEHRRSFNGMLDRRPAAVALVESVEDVLAAMDVARAEDLRIAVRGGGHSVAGHGLLDDGLVIDLRRMRGVEIDPATRRARVQGGATWEDFDNAAQAHGLAVTGGTFVDTGVGGLALGGGIGFLLGSQGLTCDNIVGAQLVTADGALREVNAETDPDLLWALRGGGGNFGIATRLDFTVHHVGAMCGDSVLLGLGDGSVIGQLARVMAKAPDTFVALAYVANREEFGPSVSIHIASLADEESTRPLYDEILRDARVIRAGFRPLTYAEILNEQGGQAAGQRAQAMLRPLLSQSGNDPVFQQRYARASELAGDSVRASEAYAEAAFLGGRPEQALIQLQALKRNPALDYVGRARVDARIESITPTVLELRRQGVQDPDLDRR